jgi:hypothetical protein
MNGKNGKYSNNFSLIQFLLICFFCNRVLSKGQIFMCFLWWNVTMIIIKVENNEEFQGFFVV